MKKTALLGFHSWDDIQINEMPFQDNGYSIEYAETPEEMLKKTTEKEYDFYVMDVNLGDSGGTDFTCIEKIKELIKNRVNESRTRLFGLSCDKEVVIKAREKGLPALEKYDFSIVSDENFELLKSGTLEEIANFAEQSK